MKSKKNSRATKSSLRKNRQVFGVIMIALSAFLLLLFVSRFVSLSMGQADDHNLKKSRIMQVTHTSVLQAKRGEIVDADGTVIAESGNTYKVYALLKSQYKGDKRKKIQDKQKTADVLSRYLNLSSAAVLAKLNPANKQTTQVEFGTAGASLSLDTKQRIQAEKIPGLYFEESSTRLYPNGIFSSHVIGLVASKKNEQTGISVIRGRMGLEREFNSVLEGKNGSTTAETDGFGYQLVGGKTKKTPARNGGTVYTTINTNLQSYLETLMDSLQSKYAPKELTATVMNAKTGAILATSERPTFDPVSGTGLSKWSSDLYQDVYEPGSIMKIMTLAASIDSGTYKPNEYYQSGHVKIGGGTIYDWQKSGWGSIPLSQAFPRSSNTGMVQIEQNMGASTWRSYLKKFGFGTKTGITLPDESTGNISFNGKLNQASTAFGQAINVTQVQMLRAMTAIANNGVMVQPRVVSKVVSRTGQVTNYGTKSYGRVISQSAAEGVRAAMKQVVNATYGTGNIYKIKGVDLGVKTGTAQVAGTHGYLSGTNNYTFSVAGMFPLSKPKYIVYLTMRQPQKMTTDDQTMLNSIFTPLVKRTIALTGSTATPGKTSTMPNVTGQTLTSAEKTLKDYGQKVAVVGSGNKVVQQLPAAGQELLSGSRSIILTNGAMTMPSVIGWGKSDVLKLAQITGVSFTLKGEGFASAQSLKAGSLMSTNGGTIKFSGQ
ncbi:MAG: penicillin-binding protein [Lacticaseibacillus songhuajiangensis]|jgi:penicillin-binding protein 2B|nr:penicillin-binding protein [Lacticaseibacillus songhuajiangensis]